MSEALIAPSSIAGIGAAVPARVVENAEVAARLGIEPDWIVARTGIRERRVAMPHDTVAGLAARAGAQALAEAGVPAADVDLLLVATTHGDAIMPSVATAAADLLGTRRAGAIDLDAACNGFLSGIALAAGMLESGRARNVLLIGSEILSRITDHDDRRTAALFGDGAGALLLTSAAGIGPVILRGEAAPALLYATHEERLIRMQGHEVFRHAVTRMTEITRAACAAAGVAIEEIDHFVFHQANARILRSVGQRLGVDAARVVDVIHRYGNTSTATIPLALDALRPEPGARVLVAAFGAGFSWGGTVITW